MPTRCLPLVPSGSTRLPMFSPANRPQPTGLMHRALYSGADCILLIAAILPNSDLEYMIKVANTIGLQCLIEVISCPLPWPCFLVLVAKQLFCQCLSVLRQCPQVPVQSIALG